MSRIAELNDENVVQRVIVAESLDWVSSNLGGTWVETFKDGTRKNYAGIGFVYDELRDAFIPPQPFDSWLLNEDTCLWESPVPYPSDDAEYVWDDKVGDWVAV